MISEECTRTLSDQSHISTTLTAPVDDSQSCRRSGKGFQTSTPTSPSKRGWSNSNRDRVDSVSRVTGTRVTSTRQGTFELFKVIHSSKPTANPEFFNNVIKIPQGWTNVIYHSSSQDFFGQNLLNGLIAGGDRHERRQTSMLLLSRASARKQRGTRSENWEPQLVPYVHHRHTDTICEIDVVQSTKNGSKILFKHSVLLLFTSETTGQNAWQESSDTIRLFSLFTIRRRTTRTGNPSRCPCIGRPTAGPRSTAEKARSHQELNLHAQMS